VQSAQHKLSAVPGTEDSSAMAEGRISAAEKRLKETKKEHKDTTSLKSDNEHCMKMAALIGNIRSFQEKTH